MELIFKIAWRNILRHKGKSIVIGIILFLGALIMTVGNGVLSGMDNGLRENIVDRFTGQIVIVSTNQKFDSVIFPIFGKNLTVMSGYTNIRSVLEKQKDIQKFLPVCRGNAMILNENGDPGFTFLLGVNFDDYQNMFISNVEIVEGKLITNGERGLLVARKSRDNIYDQQGFWVYPEGFPVVESNFTPSARSNLSSMTYQSNMVFLGFSDNNSSSDIRCQVKGIVQYHNLNSLWGTFSIVDIESFRELFNYSSAKDAEVKLSTQQTKLINATSEDDILAQMTSDTTADVSSSTLSLNTIRTETVKVEKLDLDKGSYNMVFVKLKHRGPVYENLALKEINRALSNANVDGRAITWKQAAGQIADLATIIRGALFGFVLFIFFVAVIIIMNTLSMAAMERVTEIGMMRAVGAKKDFISNMFALETTLLSVVFGGAGIVVGALVVWVLSLFHITTTNEILQLLFGGEYFRPVLYLRDILGGIVQLVIVTLIAMIYPTRLARRITPLEAIARD
jgi:ABC-type lipoprotein release transport system permease subunit